ncbi:MAG: FAD:protein FMN transferase [Aristaeellaceae bacterium]
MKRRLLCALLLSALLLTGCAAQDDSASAPDKVSGVGYYFDTVVTLTLYGAPEGLLDTLWQECGRYERLLSRTVPSSDVDRINRAGGETVQVDPETWTILKRATEISRLTEGAFSVTIAPLSTLWDFTGDPPRMPDDAQRLSALPLVDDSRLQLGEDHTVTLPAGMSIDLGGIAKGYIADQLAGLVRGKVTGATLNFGGNVYALGNAPGAEGFNIGIAHPQSPSQAIAAIRVLDRSVVTSGTYQRCFEQDGRVYHHILDPRTGLPAETGLVSASIVAESSMTADALATACIVLGEERALALLEALGCDGLLIREDMTIVTTPGLKDKYPLQTAGQAG